MIQKSDILSMEYLKMTEFTGSFRGMRYRLERADGEDGVKLKATVWPEPFNFFSTPEEEKTSALFAFDEDGVSDAVDWMNDRYFEERARWEQAPQNWDAASAGRKT
ncbi:MAG: hypothetical protein NC399_08760 [Muribaculum sp.]|nr:hypothetical protein [Muribaculum sp.]